MAIPSQSFTISDPGLGITEPATTTVVALGVCESGTPATLYTFSSQAAAVASLGQGPLTETVCQVLSQAGGPVLAMPMAGDGNAANSVVTAAPIGAGTGTITIAGTANDSYDAIVEIMTSGTLGTGTFRYSLDGGNNYSSEMTIPAGATFLFPSTGITATFIPGAGPVFFQDGDTHTFTTTPDHFNSVALAAGIVVLLASTETFDMVVLAGRDTSAANAATLFGALDTAMDNLEAGFRFVRSMIDAGDDTTANVATAFDAVAHNRISVGYGTADITSAKPFPGWGTPARSIVDVMAATAAKSLISTDLSRVASGPLTGVSAISHDEYLTEELDVHRISTMRTWLGRPGFYFTNVRIKSAAGSDYLYWQFGRLMDVASKTTYEAQQLFISIGVRTNSDGTIDERDAQRLETKVREPLRIQLSQPANAEGTQGHVSALAYAIDRTNNLQLSQELLSTVAIRPLGYPKFITTTLGFQLNV